MTQALQCAVCSAIEGLTGVVVGGETMLLCESHAEKLGERSPDSFSALAQWISEEGAAAAGEQRSGRHDRRKGERRQFPPRPEGRRFNGGRREGDPQL